MARILVGGMGRDIPRRSRPVPGFSNNPLAVATHAAILSGKKCLSVIFVMAEQITYSECYHHLEGEDIKRS